MFDDFDTQIQAEEVYPWPDSYTLTLTTDERAAFDWVGMRYNAGDVANLLYELVPVDQEWDDSNDITFNIPEHVAWEIYQLAEEEDFLWPCFAPDLVDKLQDFLWGIV